MSAILDTFNAIKAELETITSVKTVKLFNSQIDNEERENPFSYPAVFIEFQEIIWLKRTRGVKEGETTITLHVAVESYKNETDSAPDVLAITNEVHVKIEGFGGGCFTELSKSAERQDIDHDNCIVWQLDYETLVTDGAADDRLNLILTPGTPDLEVIGDLDIDNEVIRTGDGDFTP